jgi:hypothetical protein
VTSHCRQLHSSSAPAYAFPCVCYMPCCLALAPLHAQLIVCSVFQQLCNYMYQCGAMQQLAATATLQEIFSHRMSESQLRDHSAIGTEIRATAFYATMHDRCFVSTGLRNGSQLSTVQLW